MISESPTPEELSNCNACTVFGCPNQPVWLGWAKVEEGTFVLVHVCWDHKQLLDPERITFDDES